MNHPGSAATPSPAPAPLLRFEGIGKSFDGVPVLRSVSWVVPAGRTVGLVGENGAGKSTLMNILGGNLRPDAGRMVLGGQPYAPRSSADATRAGIAFVHQELNLFGNLTVAENLALTRLPTWAPFPVIDRKALHRQARELLDRVGLDLAPETPVDRLSAGERQLVEIAAALGARARILILDEPTTSLTARESARLFECMDQLRRRNLALIFVSHALPDVLRHCDDLLVLRDGAVADAGPTSSFDVPAVIRCMVGRDLSQVFPPRRDPDPTPSPAPPPLLEVRDLRHPGIVDGISFEIGRGEILGLAGLMGAGRSELARIVFGLEPCREGQVLLDGRPMPPGSRARQAAGMALLTEDRRRDGLCLDASIAENLALVGLPGFAGNTLRWLESGKLRRALEALRRVVCLPATAPDDRPVRTLSGGNQQKVILGKWLLARPRVLLLDEPTRGIDVGAKFEIYRQIRRLADDGAAVLLVSSELEELLGLCDRILVMARGRIRDDIPRAEFGQERILRAALPA